MSSEECVQLVANFNYISKSRQYNCKNKTHESDERRSEAFKNRNGCEFRIQEKPRQTVLSINFHSCFCDHLHDQFDYLVWLYSRYSEGILPFSGSLSEQPNHIIEIFQIFDALKALNEKEQAKANK